MKQLIKILLPILLICTQYGCSKSDNSLNNGGGTGVGGSLARFTISGNHLYIVDNTRLSVYDISNASSPVLKTNINLWGGGIETIYPYKDKLFIGSNTAMYIYSIANPASPTYEGMATHVRACDPVVANDDYAFVTVRSGVTCGGVVNALLVYNIQGSATDPQLTHQYNLKNPHGLGLKGDILYVCDYDDGLKILNVATAANPTLVNTVTGYSFKDVIVYGDILVVMATEGMVIYDITNPINPVFVKLVK